MESSVKVVALVQRFQSRGNTAATRSFPALEGYRVHSHLEDYDDDDDAPAFSPPEINLQPVDQLGV